MKRFGLLATWRTRRRGGEIDWLALAVIGDEGQLRPFQAWPAPMDQAR